MACIDKIYSVSVLIGDNKCNAKCAFCAATKLRKEVEHKVAPNLESAIKLSARYGGWSLSLTSSGEPTCDPEAITEALTLYKKCADQGAYFPNVVLFTNGILMGNSDFCDKYLPLWKSLGLTGVVVSIHGENPFEQEKVYNIEKYPEFSTIFNNIKRHKLQPRATLLLRKDGVDSPKKYWSAVHKLRDSGCSNITSWAVGNPDGTSNEFSPTFWQLLKIRLSIFKNTKKCHGHVWGGGVYDYNGMILRYTTYVTKHSPNGSEIRQLVVFQDNTVCYSWIKEGALCIK